MWLWKLRTLCLDPAHGTTLQPPCLVLTLRNQQSDWQHALHLFKNRLQQEKKNHTVLRINTESKKRNHYCIFLVNSKGAGGTDRHGDRYVSLAVPESRVPTQLELPMSRWVCLLDWSQQPRVSWPCIRWHADLCAACSVRRAGRLRGSV